MNQHEHCPTCGAYWRSSAVFSNGATRSEEYFCVNGHRWTRILRFDGYAADGTRCYTTAPPFVSETKEVTKEQWARLTPRAADSREDT